MSSTPDPAGSATKRATSPIDPGSSTGLGERIKAGKALAIGPSQESNARLLDIARRLDMPETAEELERVGRGLSGDEFALMVVGRFKNGKSTLLNALLGGVTEPVDLDGHQGPMVVDELPCTAVLTGIRFSREPYVKAWHADRRAERWSLGEYLRNSTLEVDELESQRKFAGIIEFEMGFPARLCEAGVIVYDSPGLDDVAPRTAITKEASKHCDAALVVYRSDGLMGQSELVDAATLGSEGTKVFTVVNMIDREPDDRFRAFVWNKYVRDHLGEGDAWDGEDLSSKDIYFVDAEMACDARYGGAGDGVERSGLATLEERLSDFLLNERQQAHVRKFNTRAVKIADQMAGQIAQRQRAADVDSDTMRTSYERLQPRLVELRDRPARLPPVFHQAREDAGTLLVTSFGQEVEAIRSALPAHLENTTLPSESRKLGVLAVKQLQAEASAVASQFITARLDQWRVNVVPTVLAPVLERVRTYVAREIAQVHSQFAEIDFELTGWRTPPESAELIGSSERVLAAVTGLLVTGPAGAVTGGAGGWRGALGGIGGGLGALVLATAIGATGWFLILPAMVVATAAGLLTGGVNLAERVKEKAAEAIGPYLDQLQLELRPALLAELDEEFTTTESAITKDITDAITAQTRNLEHLIDLNQRGRDEQARRLGELSAAATTVAGCRARLAASLPSV